VVEDNGTARGESNGRTGSRGPRGRVSRFHHRASASATSGPANGRSCAPASEAGRVSAACTGNGQPRRDEHPPVFRTLPLSAVGRGWRRAANRLRQRRESVAVERSFAAEGNQCAAGVGSESLAVDSTVANRECVARKFRRAGGRVVRDLDQGWFAGSERLGRHKNEGF